jgi:hypothetical protein
MNIVEMITSQFGSQIVGAIAGALGIEQDKAHSGLASSIPALLAGLVGLTAKPEGTRSFSTTLNEADTDSLDNLVSGLQGGNQDSLVETGTKMLGSLFNENNLGGLVSALAGAIGLKSGITKSLIGLAAPAVMGLLKKEQKSQGLDINGLVAMLQGQKKNISAALPQDLTSQLTSAGLLQGFADAPAAAARSASTAASQVARETAKTGGSIFSWLIPLVILAAVLWFAWQYFLAPKPGPVATSVPEATQAAPAGAPSLVVEGVDLGQELGSVINGLGSALAGISDAASAEAIAAELNAQGQRLGGIAALVDKLPSAGRQALAALLGPQFARLESLAKQVMDLPGVGPILTPVVSPLLAEISTLLNP